MRNMRQSDRRAACTDRLRVVWFDELVQLAPRGHTVDFGEQTVTPCQLLFGSVFEVGEAPLHDRWRAVNIPILSQVDTQAGTSTAE